MEIIKISHAESTQYSVSDHHSNVWEVVLITEGEGTFFYVPEDAGAGEARDGEKPEETGVFFRAGDIFVIPPGTERREESTCGFRSRTARLANFRPIGRMGVKWFRDDERGSVAMIFDMAEYFDRQEVASAGAVVNSLGDVLYHTLVTYYDKSRNKDLRLEGVIDLMHANVANPEFDLARAIEDSGYSMGYFRRIFKEMTGEPPASYLQHLRITRAKSLFQQYGGSRTVKEVAGLCGYADPLYFSRVFRMTEGMSPKNYLEKVTGRERSDDGGDT